MSEVFNSPPTRPAVVKTSTGFELHWPTSGNISATRYHTQKQVLEIDFKNGKTYEYFDVPVIVWNNLIAEESIGSFVHTNIKGNFKYSQILK